LKLRWTSKAQGDLVRLYEFLEPVNPRAALAVVDQLSSAPEILLEQPRIGRRLRRYPDREVRKLIIGNYELHYEVRPGETILIRIWHGREDR